MVILRSSSSGRQSTLLVPLATRPCLSTDLAMNNAASISEVLPLEAWPTTATVRIFEVSTGIGGSPETVPVFGTSLDPRIFPESESESSKKPPAKRVLSVLTDALNFHTPATSKDLNAQTKPC